MEKKLSGKEYVFIGSLLFGLFFGAGNLIFPVQMGQLSGADMLPATLGFLTTAVGLPFLGIVAMGMSRKDSLYELASKVSPGYSMFYTCALYLTIGPFFAIPRTATVSFESAFAPYLPANQLQLVLLIFSALFFGSSLWFSLKPTEILKWVGKVLNPIFLVSVAILIAFGMFNPMGEVATIPVAEAYQQQGSFFKGFLEGYNTMDALASLAFGIIIVSTIKNLGVTKPASIAKDTIISGIFSMSLMGIIYASLVYLGATSRGIIEVSPNGGVALADISRHYFGGLGGIVLAVIITVACYKTAVGLITAISEMFVTLFPNKLTYNHYVYVFTAISFIVANLGLNQIIAFSIPVLMFLYPLAITLIVVTILSPLFKDKMIVYQMTTIFTLPFALIDFLHALPKGLKSSIGLDQLSIWAKGFIPLFSVGMGWLIPAIIGFIIGLVLTKRKTK
ncbi:branched-chain amino acid transport system II carrier protein [Jeotgalibaca sp. MA1X17-3]|uniref:branched-chain amino acid transport system II carrier protein n=1 Tax=Jeotgalibaca sp. MA1X17-3 TaxID=2908211 RepID=UPI001F2F553E|nr:branched-chain amino acid transport system II carrier protein [Jeotgalibaca sp. MA1X17-3]UJF16409.1 branched-chain amino acid transport system II carrier protein [Jeotgalibaca sp. MA1X17-3]